MSNESKEDRHRAAMQKALSTSMLIHLSEEEMLSLSDSWQKNQGCSFGAGCPCRSDEILSEVGHKPPDETNDRKYT